jgi:hypothetical protein
VVRTRLSRSGTDVRSALLVAAGLGLALLIALAVSAWLSRAS